MANNLHAFQFGCRLCGWDQGAANVLSVEFIPAINSSIYEVYGGGAGGTANSSYVLPHCGCMSDSWINRIHFKRIAELSLMPPPLFATGMRYQGNGLVVQRWGITNVYGPPVRLDKVNYALDQKEYFYWTTEEFLNYRIAMYDQLNTSTIRLVNNPPVLFEVALAGWPNSGLRVISFVGDNLTLTDYGNFLPQEDIDIWSRQWWRFENTTPSCLRIGSTGSNDYYAGVLPPQVTVHQYGIAVETSQVRVLGDTSGEKQNEALQMFKALNGSSGGSTLATTPEQLPLQPASISMPVPDTPAPL